MDDVGREGYPVGMTAFLALALAASVTSAPALPRLVMYPPGQDGGKCFRDLFEHPDQWQRTRGLLGTLGYADHVLNKQFSDAQLAAWLPKLSEWGIKLELEVGAVKEWGPTGEKTFKAENPAWQRFERLGGHIYSIAMDEPLCCTRFMLHKPDAYAVDQTANFIALVRKNYPDMLIGDIEPTPSISVPDLTAWIDALQKRLADMGVRGLDFFRVDVDWVHYIRGHGSWADLKRLEDQCHARGLPFSLIYWAADYPELKKRGFADDATWYAGVLQMGYNYLMAGGAPDQYVVESWVGAPSASVPETADFTFTRSVLDLAERIVKPAH